MPPFRPENQMEYIPGTNVGRIFASAGSSNFAEIAFFAASTLAFQDGFQGVTGTTRTSGGGAGVAAGATGWACAWAGGALS